MRSNSNRAMTLAFALALCVLVLTTASCKSSGMDQSEPPTAESLTLAVCEHFEQSGYKQDESGVFRSANEDFALFQNPAHVIRVDCDEYPFQGIMTRKATLKKEHGAERVYLVIMWWDAKENKWVHLTGKDIPEINYGLQ